MSVLVLGLRVRSFELGTESTDTGSEDEGRGFRLRGLGVSFWDGLESAVTLSAQGSGFQPGCQAFGSPMLTQGRIIQPDLLTAPLKLAFPSSHMFKSQEDSGATRDERVPMRAVGN